MSNNLSVPKRTPYHQLITINRIDFSDKSVLLVGASRMAHQFAVALKALKVANVTVLSRTEASADGFRDNYGFKPLFGGFEKQFPNLPVFDLVIIALPTHLLLPATECAVRYGHNNILIEKPASVYTEKLIQFQKIVTSQRIRIGYNRLLYPNYHRLKELIEIDGGVTSCQYNFTEWLHTIDYQKDGKEAYERWGINNTLHIISMAHEIIGMPVEMSSFRRGSLSWHPSGSTFVGAGITDKKVLFSYQADWGAAGRWGIDIITRANIYRLVPLEDLSVCKKGKTAWEKIEFEKCFPDVKQGVAEEVAVMLDRRLEELIEMTTLEKVIQYNRIAEKIFGYH
jgi:predicted dehydrogenase